MVEAICGSQFAKKVIPLIDEAKKHIAIVVFDWRWYVDDPANPVSLFNQAIIRAHRRGVKVECIANTEEALLILRENGIVAKRPATSKMIHAKMILIDDDVIVIGSHNYTQNAFTTNHEISAIITGEANDAEFYNFFNNLMQIYG